MKLIIPLCLFMLLPHIKALGQNNDYRDSDTLRRLLALSKESPDKVQLYWDLANAYLLAYPDSAATSARIGMELAQKIKDKNGELSCMHLLCVSLANLGNYVGALDIGFKALALAEDTRKAGWIIHSDIVLLNCYREQEDYREALKYGYNAEKLLAHPYPKTGTATVALGLLSSVLERNNQLDSALYFAEKSYELTNGFSEIYGILGNIHGKLGQPELALDYYRKGIPVSISNSANTGLIEIYNGMSKAFVDLGKTDSAVYYAYKSISQLGIRSFPEGVLKASRQLVSLYELKGINDSTIKYLKLENTIKDSMFSRKKMREAQNYEFNETLNQQKLSSQKQLDITKTRTYALLSIITVFLLLGYFLWRNNLRKQKVNALLRNQKQEIQNTLTELKSTQAQLIQSEKMASLGELTAGIAHEIQNPLNFVNNFSEINKELLSELKDEMKNGKIFEANEIANSIIENEDKISHHGQRADAIVKGMMQHSRVSSNKKESIQINTLADESLRLSYYSFRAKDKSFNAILKTDFDNNIENINVIPQDIGRVLLNLFNNAFYAVDEKSKQLNNDYKPTVEVSTKKVSNKLAVRIKDNGNGIPDKVLSKIFQPFFTTKPTGKGTGLGLSLSFDIIKAHGGEIRVESKENEGSVFTIVL